MTIARGRELALALAAFALLAVVMTWPVAAHPGGVGRADTSDGQFAIWNVAWVAHALLHSPRHVLDANIFYPHRGTLAYSETNLGAGALAVPVYWATDNPYAAFNAVFLLSFVLSGTGAYYLARHLTGDWRAAAIAGIGFAYCPYALGHTPHIQLLMTFGLPFSLLAFHRLVDEPTVGRGVGLGAIMALQTFFCGYYAIFIVLIVGWAVLVCAATRRLWTSPRYWRAVGAAAATATVGALPLVAVYATFRRGTGFERGLDEARIFAATWHAYLTTGSYAGGWLWRLGLAVPGEPLFSGVVVTSGAVAAVTVLRGRRALEMAWLYGGLALLAAWASFGPDAGLYRVLYAIVPGFGFLRAPSRFGLVVALALAVLASAAAGRLLERVRRPGLVGAVLIAATAATLAAPLDFRAVPPVEPAYRLLATLPRAGVLELPVYSRQFAFLRAQYMLDSTTHWMPIVNAYSDYTPPDFDEASEILADFPTGDALRWLKAQGVRYAVVHVTAYNPTARAALESRLAEYAPELARRYADDRIRLYEILP